MPKFPFPCGLRTEAVRYRTDFGHHRVAVASTILFNSELYKRLKFVARRHVVGASHDPHTGTALWPHGDHAENARF